MKEKGEWEELKKVERGRIMRRKEEIMREKKRKLQKIEKMDKGKEIKEKIVEDEDQDEDEMEFLGGII